MSIRPIPYGPASAFSFATSAASGSSSPSSATGTPAANSTRPPAEGRRGRIAGERVRLLGRRGPRVLEHAGLDRAAEQVLVDRERRRLRGLDGDALGQRVLDLLVARPDPVAEGRDHAQVGVVRLERELEAELIVPLAGAAVDDRLRAELLGQLGDRLGDHRPREGGDERVLALVERVRLDRAGALLLGEGVLAVDQDDVVGAGGARALDRRLEVELLADVDEDGDDLVVAVPVLLQPADDAARIRPPEKATTAILLMLHSMHQNAFHANARLMPSDTVRGLPPARGIPRGSPAGRSPRRPGSAT